MIPIDPAGLPLPVLIAVFAAAAAAVWLAGSRLTGAVNTIAERAKLGKAFAGMLLLGGITSLPEVAAVSTSAAIGNAPLAMNNLLGTASVNLVLLAVADAIYGRGALTAVAATPSTLMQGVLAMLLGSLVALVATTGDVAMFGVGVGSSLILAGAAAAIWIASRFERRHVWEAVGREEQERAIRHEKDRADPDPDERSMRRLVATTVATGATILIAGFALSTAADAISDRTGFSAGLFGFLVVGLATSLPEISSITAAVRLREYDMAVGDIFGTNLFNFSLIFLADLVYAGGPVLGSVGAFEAVGAILAVSLTGIYLVGLLERRSISLWRLGLDSVAVLVAFAAGVAALAQLRG